MRRSLFGRGFRPWIVAFVLVGAGSLFAGGLLTGQEAGAGRSADAGGPMPSTLTGSYLAALHATSDREEAAAARYYLAALERAPKDPVLLTRTATALVLDGRTKDAIPYARRLVAEDPASDTGRLILAVAAIADGRYAQAETELKALPTSLHAATTVPLLTAWAAFGRGDTAAALAALQAVRDGEAGSSSTYLALLHSAWLKDAAGDSRGAAEDLSQLLETQKEPWLRLAKLGIGVFRRAGRDDTADALQQQYLSRQPESSALGLYVKEQRADSELKKARDGAAEALFDASGVFARQNDRETALLLGQLGLYLEPDFPALQLVVADLLENFDRLADANRTYAAINASSPLAWVGRLSMAQNLDQLDQFAKAEALLRAMASERPGDPEALIQLGDLLRRHERYAEAVVAYDEAAARIPTLDKRHWRLLYARGISLERSKQWTRAEADFVKALDLEPDQPFVLNYLGYSWVEQGKNLDRAEELIKRAVQLRPNDGYIVDSLGWVLYRLGRPEEAVAHMERAVELRPEDPVINDHLGDVYWAVGRQREARYQWLAALSRNPEPDLRATIEQKLQRGLIKEANAAP